ncbi:hypothetical protein KUF71_023102 [Frankliniella fusca]|uniref:Uncharacterized protein n=1 Tax=Frankliniella fusca TaxID=407009 RepID=A0AAE1H2C6_9NEOP|nr:hypothetical protein KUF71_023102 [Frankliniella fusca]
MRNCSPRSSTSSLWVTSMGGTTKPRATPSCNTTESNNFRSEQQVLLWLRRIEALKKAEGFWDGHRRAAVEAEQCSAQAAMVQNKFCSAIERVA